MRLQYRYKTLSGAAKEDRSINRQLDFYQKTIRFCPVIRRYVYSLWAMGRPLFLIGTTPIYGLGAAVAWHFAKTFQVSIFVAGLFLVWFIQLMTHYNNEYWDLETDLATETPTRISGGSRALVRKMAPRITARIAALSSLFLVIALASFMVTIMDTDTRLLSAVGVAAFLGWFYSAKPLRLESTGFGEAVIVIVSCFILPLISYYLQDSIFRPILMIACVPIGLLTYSLILTTEIPDFSADKATGKKTLVVRLGKTRAMRLIVVVLAAGWLTFVVVVVRLWPFWGWISSAVSILILAAIGLNLRTVNEAGASNVEKTGLIISLLIGYASICLILAFLLGFTAGG